MRLVCPRCGAQYEIDAEAIPARGRDVECSACEHVWRAYPAGFDPAARPALSRPLDESVIEILRGEAARELEARAAEREAERATARTAAALARHAPPDTTLPGDAPETPAEGLVARDAPSRDADPAAGGSFIGGQGGVVRFDGSLDPIGPKVLFVTLGADGSNLTGGSRAAQWMILDQLIDEVRGRIGPDSQFALLTPAGRSTLAKYIGGGGRVAVNVHRAADIA